MEERKRLIKPGPVAALIVYAIVIICMIYVFPYGYHYFGIWGIMVTEGGIFIISLLGMAVTGMKLKEMMPFKRIHINETAGTILIWAGLFAIVIVVNFVVIMFCPQMLEESREMGKLYSGMPIVITCLLMSVAPAICEETLHRGFILRCFKARINNRFLICVIAGLLFGINHMDMRFINAGLLGGTMSYILLETDNFIYNMLFHFANNFFVDVIVQNAGSETYDFDVDTVLTILPVSIGAYLIIGCVSPLLIVGGILLLKGKKKLKAWGSTRIIVSVCIAAAVGFVMLLAGILIITAFSLTMPDQLTDWGAGAVIWKNMYGACSFLCLI